MKNFLKIASGADVGPLRLELQRQPHLWNVNSERLWKGSPHDQTDDIWLRFGSKEELKEKGFKQEHTSVWYPAFYALPAAKRLIFDLMARVEAERLLGVLIYRVPAGKEIRVHSDKGGWHADVTEKFNFSIQSQPGCAFYYPEDQEEMTSSTGDVYWFRNTVPHGVKNESKEDQIIMTVCVQTHTVGEL